MSVCRIDNETCTAYRLPAFQTDFCLNHQNGEKPVSRTKNIISEMRAADQAHAARNAEKLADGRMKGLPRIHPSRLDASQQKEAQALLRGSEDLLDRNNVKRDTSLPRRALSMASSKGRVTPDMLASVLAYFQNPSDMAQALLVSFLPTKVSLADAKRIVAERAAEEGWGEAATAALLADLPTILKSLNPNTGRNGGAPSRLIIADGVTPASVPTGKRGRPSGPKYVDYLVPTADVCEAAALLLTGPRPMYGPPAVFGIPGGNDVAQGTGRGYGAEVWTDGRMAWHGRFATPAQRSRRDADLDAYHMAEAKAQAERLAQEDAE